MSTRYITNVVMALAGGLVVVATQSFPAATAASLAFAVGIGLVAVLMTVQLDRSRGLAQRAFDGIAIALGCWTILASLVFPAPLVTWLSLAEGLGFVALAFAALTAHELTTERIVHSLELSPDGERLGAQ
jgi:hypothetical protein